MSECLFLWLRNEWRLNQMPSRTPWCLGSYLWQASIPCPAPTPTEEALFFETAFWRVGQKKKKKSAHLSGFCVPEDDCPQTMTDSFALQLRKSRNKERNFEWNQLLSPSSMKVCIFKGWLLLRTFHPTVDENQEPPITWKHRGGHMLLTLQFWRLKEHLEALRRLVF